MSGFFFVGAWVWENPPQCVHGMPMAELLQEVGRVGLCRSSLRQSIKPDRKRTVGPALVGSFSRRPARTTPAF